MPPRSHGMTKTKPYQVWAEMLSRCRNPKNKAYVNYGGRGIRVCKRWWRFENFWADMKADYHEGLTLERKNNDRGYSKANCVWATRKEQQLNRRSRHWVLVSGMRVSLGKAALIAGISIHALRYRVKRWPRNKWLIPTSHRNKHLGLYKIR